jgi:hypothetical protein
MSHVTSTDMDFQQRRVHSPDVEILIAGTVSQWLEAVSCRSM